MSTDDLIDVVLVPAGAVSRPGARPVGDPRPSLDRKEEQPQDGSRPRDTSAQTDEAAQAEFKAKAAALALKYRTELLQYA